MANDLIIDDSNADQHFNPVIDGDVKGHGLIPRQHSIYPPQMFDPPSQMRVIPRSEWSDKIKQKIADKSQLSDILKSHGFQCLDQGNNGYCWSHSTVHCVMVKRLVNNQPHVPLSAYAVAATIKKGKNEGGWCGLSAQFLRTRGVPTQRVWPQGDRNYQAYDNSTTWENAKKYRTLEEWADLTRNVWDQNLTFDQVATCLLNNDPCALDFNWWAHSVCGLDLVETSPGQFGIRILNSWGMRWGENGMGVLSGSKAIPNGALCIRSVTASQD